MLKVHVWFHKDGDHLAIVRVPWWTDIYEWLVNRICPCCGFTGFLSRIGWFEELDYKVWSQLLNVIHKHEIELYKLPVESGCVISRALWDDDSTCFRDDCEHCWHNREDAFVGKGDDMMHR